MDLELRRKPARVMTLAHEASDALQDFQAEYLAELGEQAIRLARKDRLRTVDREHVEQAASQLGTTTNRDRLSSAANTLGGLIAGAGLASTYALAFTQDQHSTAEIITAIILCIIGFSILSVGITTTFVGRR
jgi:histone H3/H4